LATVEFFGTLYKVNARWSCPLCKKRNMSKLGIPLRREEHLVCGKCKKIAIVTIQFDEIPRYWGGTKDEVQDGRGSEETRGSYREG
jgi:hypothetical protein